MVMPHLEDYGGIIIPMYTCSNLYRKLDKWCPEQCKGHEGAIEKNSCFLKTNKLQMNRTM